jgi:hypothetical protein
MHALHANIVYLGTAYDCRPCPTRPQDQPGGEFALQIGKNPYMPVVGLYTGKMTVGGTNTDINLPGVLIVTVAWEAGGRQPGVRAIGLRTVSMMGG